MTVRERIQKYGSKARVVQRGNLYYGVELGEDTIITPGYPTRPEANTAWYEVQARAIMKGGRKDELGR